MTIFLLNTNMNLYLHVTSKKVQSKCFVFMVLFQIKNIGNLSHSNLSFIWILFCIFFSRRGTHNHRFLSSSMSELWSILSQRLVLGSDVISHAPLYLPGKYHNRLHKCTTSSDYMIELIMYLRLKWIRTALLTRRKRIT